MSAWLPLPARGPGLMVAICRNPGTTPTAAGPIIQTVAAHSVSFKDAAAEAGVRIGPLYSTKGGIGRSCPGRPNDCRCSALPGQGGRFLGVGQILGLFVRTPPISWPQSPAVKPQFGFSILSE
jgi:hypothetical protein